MENKEFKISGQFANGLLEYLSTRPYRESAGFIQGLGSMEEVVEVENEDKEPTTEE